MPGTATDKSDRGVVAVLALLGVFTHRYRELHLIPL
jgi:hypothetical protein